MTETDKNNFINKVVERIKNNFKVREIVVFGSYARRTANNESDLDILVVLDEKGFAKNYAEKLERRRKVTRLLAEYRKEIPMDVLVYSSEEWEKLQLINNSFIREINSNGVRVA